MSGIARAIVGNLDCEADFATAEGRPRPSMRRAALEVASASATLLRAFTVSDDDLLAVPVAPDRRRMVGVPALTCPELPCPELVARSACGGRDVLSWSAAPGDPGRPATRDAESLDRLPLHASVWHWPRPAFAAAALANDRRRTLQWAKRLGVALRGATVADSLSAADSAIGAIGGPWVAKAPFAAAGRWRVRGMWPRSEVEGRALEGLLRRHGAVVVEPWCRRTLDVGVVARCQAGIARIVGAHRLEVDSEGRFRGIETTGRFSSIEALPWLRPGERRQLVAVVDSVAQELGGIGYEGPFGIDAWRWSPSVRYETEDGERFHPLGEVNARMTFGLVARALIDRLRGVLAFDDDEVVALRFGRGAVPDGGLALLAPDGRPDADQTCAWLERSA